jgi:hypothetical protein
LNAEVPIDPEGDLTTYETLVVNSASDVHSFYMLVTAYDYSNNFECSTERSFTLVISEVSTPEPLSVGSCVVSSIAAHNTRYYGITIPSTSLSSGTSLTVSTVSDVCPVSAGHSAFRVGVAMYRDGLPLASAGIVNDSMIDANAGGYGTEVLPPTSVTILNPTPGYTYYLAVVGGIWGEMNAFRSMEEECQEAVTALEQRTTPISVTLSVTLTGTANESQVCMGRGSCQLDGSCSCSSSYRGSICQYQCPIINGKSSTRQAGGQARVLR